MANRDDVRTSTVALIGFIGAVVVVAIILLLMVLYYRTADRLDYERRIKEPYTELENALADQEARLVEYDIKGAMVLVLDEWKSGVRPGPPPPPQTSMPAETDAKGVEKNDTGKSAEAKAADPAAAPAGGDSQRSPDDESPPTTPAESTSDEPPASEAGAAEPEAEPKETEASDSGDVEDSDVPEDADSGGSEENQDAGP